MHLLAQLVAHIEKRGTISNTNLVMECRISIAYFDKLKPYLKDLYEHRISYDKPSKTWIALADDAGPAIPRPEPDQTTLDKKKADKPKKFIPKLAACDVNKIEGEEKKK